MSKGTVTIERERCKGCQLCVGVCPQAVLRLSEQYNTHGYPTIVLDERQHSCTGCGLCALICPDVVFTVYRAAPVRGAPAPIATTDFRKGGAHETRTLARQ